MTRRLALAPMFFGLFLAACANNEGPECCILRNLCQSACTDDCDMRGLTDIYIAQDEAMCRAVNSGVGGCGDPDEGGFPYTRAEAEAICVPSE